MTKNPVTINKMSSDLFLKFFIIINNNDVRKTGIWLVTTSIILS